MNLKLKLIFYYNAYTFIDFIFLFFLGKNRLYPAYSMSSSETDDSPVHNNCKNKTTSNTISNTTKSGLSYNFPYTTQQGIPPSSSAHQYTLPYKTILQQQQQQQLVSSSANNGNSSIASIGLNQSLSPSSENASDATLTDTESTALARKTTSLINNGKCNVPYSLK